MRKAMLRNRILLTETHIRSRTLAFPTQGNPLKREAMSQISVVSTRLSMIFIRRPLKDLSRRKSIAQNTLKMLSTTGESNLRILTSVLPRTDTITRTLTLISTKKMWTSISRNSLRTQRETLDGRATQMFIMAAWEITLTRQSMICPAEWTQITNRSIMASSRSHKTLSRTC